MRRFAILLLLSSTLFAQVPKGAEQNAALRYWNAFALMTDAKLSDAQGKQLDAIATGDAAWDEPAFGKFMDENAGAVRTMVRGTELPYCEWGVDYELAAKAPIAQVGRGRALARLNILTAKRLAAQGKGREATDHLIAGLRFGRDLSAGMPLIGVLVGASALTDDYNAALVLNQSGQLAAADKARLSAAVRALPEDSLDWSGAMRTEGAGIHRDLVNLQRSSDPVKMLRDWQMDQAALAYAHPSDNDIRDVDSIFNEAASLLKQPTSKNQAAVAALQERITKLKSIGAYLIPSISRDNERRKALVDLRQKVLASL